MKNKQFQNYKYSMDNQYLYKDKMVDLMDMFKINFKVCAFLLKKELIP